MARTQVFSTDFTGYANGDLANNSDWELNNTGSTNKHQVVSENVEHNVNTGSRHNTQLVSTITHSADQYVKATVGNLPTGNINLGVGLRMQAPSTSESMYRIVVDNRTGGNIDVSIAKYDSGTSSTIGTAVTTTEPSVPWTIEGEVEGTTIRAFINGVEITSEQDSTFSSGMPGLHGFQAPTSFHYSQFESGDVSTGITGTGSHTAATATHTGSGDVGTLRVSLSLVDRNNAAAPNDTGITAVVYDAAGGTEIHETATASITSGTMNIDLPSGTTANNSDEVFVKLTKAGASFSDDFNGCGRATVTLV